MTMRPATAIVMIVLLVVIIVGFGAWWLWLSSQLG
jgi:hypothetical protein